MNTLKQGWRGIDVRRLQEALNRKLKPIPALATDGDFGPVTRAAVLRLQAAHWLVEDGEAGPCNDFTCVRAAQPVGDFSGSRVVRRLISALSERFFLQRLWY